MKKFIGVAVVAMACSMTVMGEEAAEEFVEKSEKDFSVRISLGSAPGVEEWNASSLGTESVDADGGVRVEILAVKRWWGENNPNIGGTFGGGVFFAGNSGKEPGGTDTIELSAFGGIIQGGFAVKAGDIVVLELTPYGGLGGAENETTGFTSGNGPYYFLGIKGGVFIALGDSFELGLELGYESFDQDQELSIGGATYDTTISGSGVRGALVASILF